MYNTILHTTSEFVLHATNMSIQGCVISRQLMVKSKEKVWNKKNFGFLLGNYNCVLES